MPSFATPSRVRRGFILSVAIALCFVMVLIALILANQGRAMQTFGQLQEAEADETMSAYYGIAAIHAVLAGEANHATFGLPSLGTGNFHQPAAAPYGQEFTGHLTFQAPVTAANPGKNEAYTATTSASGITLPSDHSLAVLTATVPGGGRYGRNQYFAVYNSNSPYVLLAPGGSINVKSIHTVNDSQGTDPQIIGLMSAVYAKNTVTIQGAMNGRIYSGNDIKATAGIAYPKWPAVAIPTEFDNQLNNFKNLVMQGLDGSSLQNWLNTMHDCLHKNYETAALIAAGWGAAYLGCGDTDVIPGPADNNSNPAYPGTDYVSSSDDKNVINSPGNSDEDNDNGNLTIDGNYSLSIPTNRPDDNSKLSNFEVSFPSIHVTGDMVVNDNTVFVQNGDLKIDGAIRMGQYATLVVKNGTLQANSIEPNYQVTGTKDESCRSTIWCTKAITINNGMSYTPVTINNSSTDKNSNPYDMTISPECHQINDPDIDWEGDGPNPVYPVYEKDEHDCGSNQDNLNPIIVQTQPGTAVAGNCPGVFVLSDDTININGGTQAAGFLFAANNINVKSSTFVGAAWSKSGDINMSGTDVRFFPYWTHAFGHTAAAQETIDAVVLTGPQPVSSQQHPICYGRLP